MLLANVFVKTSTVCRGKNSEYSEALRRSTAESQ